MWSRLLLLQWLVCALVCSTTLGAVTCVQELLNYLGPNYALSADAIRAAVSIADRFNLPYRVVQTGYPGMPRYRLLVGVNMEERAAVDTVLQSFSLTSAREGTRGYILIDSFTNHEGNGGYTPALRTGSTADGQYMSARTTHENWSQIWRSGLRDGGFITEQVIPLEPDRHSLLSAQLSGRVPYPRCKTGANGNCTEWISNLLVGQTALDDASTRYPLASYLGFSRTIEHDELLRRLMHASNQNNSLSFIFYRGSGLNASFENPQHFVPPLPKINQERVVKSAGTPPVGAAVSEAVEKIPAGARILFPIGAGANQRAFDALIQRARQIGTPAAFKVDMLLSAISSNALNDAMHGTGNIALRVFFLGKNMAPFSRSLEMEIVPISLGNLGSLVKQGQEGYRYDAVVVQVSPPDANNRHSLGPNCDIVVDAIRQNPSLRIIAAINRNVPFTTGENFIEASQITASFLDDQPLASPPQPPLTEVENRIAENLATLIPDRSILQVGIGSVFGGLGAALRRQRRSEIRIWSETIGDALMNVMESGVSPNATASFGYGSTAFYTWLDRNPHVTFRPFSEVNSVTLISSMNRFHAVNTAFQVNLDGDVNAMIDPAGNIVTGPGGQPDFMQGALASDEGKSIIAIRSTALTGEGTISRIVPYLYYGPITTSGLNVSHVVTEHGIAQIIGKSRKGRAEALIRIAHPDFREALLEDAVRNGQMTVAERDAVRNSLN